MNLEVSQLKEIEQKNNNELIVEKQNNFLESRLGKIANTAMDVGLKIILPDFIENEIIDLKDTLLKNGLKEGFKKAINSAINLGKNITNMITGEFEDISQVKNTIKKGGLINRIDNVIKEIVDFTEEKGLINKKNAKKIKEGKDVILDTISSNIEKDFSEQVKSEEKIEKYIDNWKKYYEQENFNGMEKELKKIKKESEKIMPFEKTNKEIENIENIQSLIESKNGEFNLTETEKELIERLK